MKIEHLTGKDYTVVLPGQNAYTGELRRYLKVIIKQFKERSKEHGDDFKQASDGANTEYELNNINSMITVIMKSVEITILGTEKQLLDLSNILESSRSHFKTDTQEFKDLDFFKSMIDSLFDSFNYKIAVVDPCVQINVYDNIEDANNDDNYNLRKARFDEDSNELRHALLALFPDIQDNFDKIISNENDQIMLNTQTPNQYLETAKQVGLDEFFKNPDTKAFIKYMEEHPTAVITLS